MARVNDCFRGICATALGEAVRRHRSLAGISQTKLAKKVGCAPAYVSQIEAGVRRPSLKILSKISDTLNVSIAVLVSQHEKKGTVSLDVIIDQLLVMAKHLRTHLDKGEANGADPSHESQRISHTRDHRED